MNKNLVQYGKLTHTFKKTNLFHKNMQQNNSSSRTQNVGYLGQCQYPFNTFAYMERG